MCKDLIVYVFVLCCSLLGLQAGKLTKAVIKELPN